MKNVVFNIEGMTCDHCVHSVTEALLTVPGVKKAQVSLPDKKAVVTTEGNLDTQAVLQAVEQEGYQASVISVS
jgi:mercuric reductase